MRFFLRRPLGTLGLAMVILGLLAMACARSERPPDRVHVLTWDGIVNPVMERYIDRGIRTAERSQARAVVLRLDTPGGLNSSMRDVIQRIQASRVPVIVYVAPAGGQAASAGTFITMAGHVAAMAPNTTIGAATPIDSSGEDIPGALGRKITNEAVAYIRGIAEQRGRNADWAEQAVREAVAINENQAVELNVVDFVATSVEDLLAKSDGRSVPVMTEAGVQQTVSLRTLGAPTLENRTNFFEQVLYVIASPDIAFLLLSLGGLALFFEIISPGFGIGVFGIIALILAFFALGSLPTNWAGVALIAFGVLLLVVEVFVSGFGIFGIGGIAAIVFGGLILTGSSEMGFQVSRWLIFSVAAVFGAGALFLAGMILKVRRMPTHSGRESLVGAKGSVRTALNPWGTVLVAGERWDAYSDDGPLEPGTQIIVTEVSGLRLHVKRDPAFIKLLPAGSAAAGGPGLSPPDEG